MKRSVALALTLFGLTTTALGPERAEAAALPTDVLGRPVPVGEGRPTLVFYTNRHNRDVLQAHAFELAYELRAARPIVVVHVDLRDVPGLFRGMAKREVKKSHRESIAFMKQVFRKHGVEPPAELDASLFMVPATDGAAHAALNLAKNTKQVVATALDAAGDQLASGPFPATARRLTRAITSQGPGASYARR